MTTSPAAGPRGVQRPGRLLVALGLVLAVVAVALGSLLDAHASSAPGLQRQDAVAASPVATGDVVAPLQRVLPGQHRARAPDYDRSAVGSRVAPRAAGLADDALVVRGGQNLPENIATGSGVTIDAAGRAHGVSVQAGTESLETLVRGHIPHGQIGVTTAGEIRLAGGTVVRDPLPGNPYHCLVGCITPEALSNLLRPTIKNPFR